MKYLIAGLGNFGLEYQNTRHNIGFMILDAMAKASNFAFKDKRYAFKAEFKYKGRIFVLIKPTTYMNRSGLAVNYWQKKEKIGIENTLVVLDDIDLPFGKLRIKPKGSDGTHNGLINISQVIASRDYPRLRFGIGNEFLKGRQIQHVLGEWTEEEEKALPERINIAIEMIKSFGTIGVNFTMNQYNNK